MSDLASLFEQKLHIDETNHALSMLRNFDRMRNERRECDLVIKIGNDELHVHRNVMMAGSDYFDAMFSHDLQERMSGIVEMKEMKFPILKKCVDFIYTGRISIVENECEEILYVSSMLQLTVICDKVAPFLKSRINPKSFYTIKKIAVKYDLDDLNKVCDDFAWENFDLIIKEKEFGRLEMEYVSFLIKSRKESNLDDDDKSLESILQWVRADMETNREHFGAMISLLDLGKVTESVISALLVKEPVCYESAEFMKTLYFLEKNKAKAPPPRPVPKSAELNSIVVFDKTRKCLRAYRPRLGTWIQLQDLLPDMTGRARYTAAFAGSFLFVIMSSRDFYMIDITSKKADWTKLKDTLLHHGSDLQATVHDGYIYVAGSSCMERYCLVHNDWTVVKSSAAPCNYRALAACRGRIFTIGGRSNGASKGVDSVSQCFTRGFCLERPMYHSRRCSCSTCFVWKVEKPMHHSRRTCAAAVYEGDIIVAGGFNNGVCLSSVEHFDPENEVWTELEPMVEAHDEFGLCVVENCLFAVGHRFGPHVIEKYNFLKREWKIVEKISDSEIEAKASVAVHLPEKLFYDLE